MTIIGSGDVVNWCDYPQLNCTGTPNCEVVAKNETCYPASTSRAFTFNWIPGTGLQVTLSTFAGDTCKGSTTSVSSYTDQVCQSWSTNGASYQSSRIAIFTSTTYMATAILYDYTNATCQGMTASTILSASQCVTNDAGTVGYLATWNTGITPMPVSSTGDNINNVDSKNQTGRPSSTAISSSGAYQSSSTGESVTGNHLLLIFCMCDFVCTLFFLLC